MGNENYIRRSRWVFVALTIVPSSKQPSNREADQPDKVLAGDGISRDGVSRDRDGLRLDGVVGRKSSIATVSHTLDSNVAERLRHFAFRERISESAVIEFALRSLFETDDEAELGRRLREAGAALRRRNRAE